MFFNVYFGVVFFLLIFNPYTIYGKPGMIVGFAYFLLAIYKGYYKLVDQKIFFLFYFILIVSVWGVFMSIINNIPQVDFLYATLSFIFFWFSALGVVAQYFNKGGDINKIFFILLISLVFNFLIILIEAFYPSFKHAIESQLAPAGNIDWDNSFRLRGLAASGGSGLSIVAPVAVILSLYLFYTKVIGVKFLFFSLIIVSLGVFFVGRTGLVFIPLGVFLFILWSVLFEKNIFNRAFVRLVFYFFGFSFLFSFIFIYFYDFLINNYGMGFIRYSYGFLLDGSEGIKEEGTVSVLIDFMQVLPLNFPDFFVGVGFYGGSDFQEWTDSGFARVVLSVGFILGPLYYLSVLYFYASGSKKYYALVMPILLILILSEIKGSFLFSSYSARTLVVIVVSVFYYEYCFKNNYVGRQ